MSDDELANQIKEAETSLSEAETKHGRDHLVVAERLEVLASLLKASRFRTLDAANMDARAKLIRSKRNSNDVRNTKHVQDNAATNESLLPDSLKKCPYCAESVKSEARICRFCNRDLTRKPITVYSLAAVFVSIIVIVLAGWYWSSSPIKRDTSSYSQSDAPVVAPRSRISGAAWIVKGAGQSDIQRGLEIVLCNVAVSSDIDVARQNIAANYPSLGGHDYYGLLSSIRDMNRVAASNAIKVVKTDVDGKYTITDVAPGEYFLYAAYGTDFSVAYWLVPISLTGAEDVKIDFDNSNMAESHNKSIY